LPIRLCPHPADPPIDQRSMSPCPDSGTSPVQDFLVLVWEGAMRHPIPHRAHTRLARLHLSRDASHHAACDITSSIGVLTRPRRNFLQNEFPADMPRWHYFGRSAFLVCQNIPADHVSGVCQNKQPECDAFMHARTRRTLAEHEIMGSLSSLEQIRSSKLHG